MSAVELELAVRNLPPSELAVFAEWFEQYIADQWDKNIEADISAGKLDHLAEKADRDFEARRCTPL